MKPPIFWILNLCGFLLTSTSVFCQQDITEPIVVKKTNTLKIDKSKVKVQRHTIMSRFEPEIASSEEERLAKRNNHIAEIERKLSILDTLDISERRKKALLRDLKYSPFSNRLSRATADTKFEDTSDNDEN